MNSFLDLIDRFASRQSSELAPDWRSRAGDPDSFPLYDEDTLKRLSARLGWRKPTDVGHRPRAHQFPLFMYDEAEGWAIAEQFETVDAVRVVSPSFNGLREIGPGTRFFLPQMPRLSDRGQGERAINVFGRSLLLRKKVLFSAVIATVVVNLIALATSLFSMQVYDRVIPRSGYATLWVLTVGVCIALLLDFILRTTRALMIEREAAKVDTEVSEVFFARSQAVRLDARPPSIGTMAAQIRGWEQIRGLLSSASLFLLADLPFAIFFIVVISWIGGPLALIPIISFPLALVLSWIFARMIKDDTAKAQANGNRKNGLLVEALDAAETIKANRGSWHMLARWNQLMEEVQLHEDSVKRWSSIANALFSGLQQFAYVMIIAFGAVLVSQGDMTPGALIACSIIAGRVNGPLLAQLPGLLVQWGYARSSLAGLDALMRLPLDQAPDTEALRPAQLVPSLQVNDVRFGYTPERPSVEIPRLEIRAGEKVGIIGGIGSGKSTLLRLLAGLYAPAEGQIRIGGLEMRQLATDVLRRNVGYLPQDTRLLNGTMRENLLLGLSDPGDDTLMRVITEIGLGQMVSSHPMGIDLPIAEGGRGLSGGQRTLTILTRLFLAEPQMWLLDEPTSNLDQATEARLIQSIKARMTPDRTLVLVTHRMQLLSLTDRLLVMGNGKIVMDGPTGQVLAKLRGDSQGTPPSPPAPPAPVKLAQGA
ncbi:ATP-binding cassette subfamily C protein LapB [Sphingomonas kaistensis]|uniref:ATP-binding cassette subfamily C protein LapB n=1 Tax=Sphingomonas kaistensis TaxID=298708 RepID=A0A7X6BFS7_9SPHN|nr:ATP-binding cassette domain-containing protein [Sphingomonas kaistensis]NJC05709.1 ATP-binding cassette subfamily C protein LapB [Sphingomonas kaistensis]